MADKIDFYTGTKAEFDKTIKSSNGVYFVSDTREIYKGDVQYGGTATFIATPERTGIVKPVSKDFDIEEDGTLSLHHTISILSFGNNHEINEDGSTISQIQLNWELDRDPSYISIYKNNNQIEESNITLESRSILLNDQSITNDTDFTLIVKDENNTETKATTKVSFLNGIYAGVDVEIDSENINNNFINTLSKTLTDKKECIFTVNPTVDQYIYFALPSRFGEPHFYVGGVEGGFYFIKTFNFTNSAGKSEQYAIYRSTNSNLGSTIVEVK